MDMQRKSWAQRLTVVVAAVALCVLLTATGRQAAVAVAATGGIPDTGQLLLDTNQKLDQVNDQLKQLNTRMQELVDLLKSGKLEVAVGKDAKAQRPAAGEGAGGSTGAPGGGQ
jgi:conjugal transfer/entry exclusion protein